MRNQCIVIVNERYKRKVDIYGGKLLQEVKTRFGISSHCFISNYSCRFWGFVFHFRAVGFPISPEMPDIVKKTLRCCVLTKGQWGENSSWLMSTGIGKLFWSVIFYRLWTNTFRPCYAVRWWRKKAYDHLILMRIKKDNANFDSFIRHNSKKQRTGTS